jgi:hypothetical protein
MAYSYKNITGSTTQELVEYSDLKESPIKVINICNTHASDSVGVDLYLYKRNTNSPIVEQYAAEETAMPDETYYIIKNLTIPYGVTLQLEGGDLPINYKDIVYSLYIKLTASDSSVDIIINSRK